MDKNTSVRRLLVYVTAAILVRRCSANSRVFQIGIINSGSPEEKETINFTFNTIESVWNVSFVLQSFDITESTSLYEHATLLLRQNVTALIEGSNLFSIVCTLTAVTNIPLIRLHGDDTSLEQCQNALHMSADYRAYAHAAFDVINTFRWEKVLVLFHEDLFRAAAYFHAISSDSEIDVILVQLNTLNEDHEEQDTTNLAMEEIHNIANEVIVPYINPDTLRQILQQKPCHHETSHKWILQGEVPSNLTSQPNNVVVAFKLPYVNSSTSGDLETDLQAKYPHYNKDSVAMAYDAAQLINRALNTVPCSALNGSDILPVDRDVMFSCMKKVSLNGSTGPVLFNEYGRRTEVGLDILNLRNNSFLKVGVWDSANKAMLSQDLLRNTEESSQGSNLEGRKLRAVTREDDPFVKKVRNSDGSISYEGYCIDLLNELSKKLKFTYELYHSPDGTYGATTDNGEWGGMIGELINRKADVAVAALTITEKREKVVDFTIPFTYYTDNIIMKKPSRDRPPDLLQFMSPFDRSVWGATLATLVVISVATFILNYFSPYGYKDGSGRGTSEEFSFFNSVWFALACMLQQGGDNTPRSLSGRILAGCYWFCILIWVSTYTANLAAFFTVKSVKNPIGNLEDIVKTSYQVGIQYGGSTYEVFQSSHYETHVKIWQRIKSEGNFMPNASYAVRMVREREEFVYIYDGPTLQYFANQPPCDLMTVPGVTTSKGMALSLHSNDPHTDELTLGILHLHENGFLDGLKRKWWDDANNCPKEQETTLSRKRIDLISMLGVYIVLAVGVVIAFLTLLAEIVWNRKRLKSKQGPKARSVKVNPGVDVDG